MLQPAFLTALALSSSGLDGTYLKGRQEIASLHQMLFDKFLMVAVLKGNIRSIRFLTSDIAIVVTVGGTVMAGQ